MAFLIDEFGLEKFKEFYKTDYITLTLHPNEAAGEIYGKSISQLEKDWTDFLESYATGEEKRAKLFLQTWEDRSGSRLYQRLVKIWEEHPFELIGYSSKAYRLTRDRHCARVDLGNLSGPSSVDRVLKTYKEATEEVKKLLNKWLKAAEFFQAVKKKISGKSGANSKWLVSELRRIESLYLTAGDYCMANRISKQLNHLTFAFVV